MPTLDVESLRRLVDSLWPYTPEAVERAIDAARDPDVAAQLGDELRRIMASNGNREHFTEWALCVALGEARAAGQFDLLWELVTSGRIELRAAAARYALGRIGRPAFEQIMPRLPEWDPHGRVEGYYLLCAARTADAETFDAVANFLLGRIPAEETGEFAKDEWNPMQALCMALAFLDEPRRIPHFERLLEREDLSDDLADGLEAYFERYEPEEEEDGFEWLATWQEQCEQWAEIHQEIEDLDKETRRLDEVQAASEGLVEEFRRWLQGQGKPEQEVLETTTRVLDALKVLAVNARLDPRSLQLDPVRAAIYDELPAHGDGSPEELGLQLDALALFFPFLHATGRLPDAEPFVRLARKARKTVVRDAGDPSKWSLPRLLRITGGKYGFDMSDPEQARKFISEVVFKEAKHQEEWGEPSDEPGDWDEESADDLPYAPPDEYEPLNPIRRTAPKVGRNDPCPCGSGKKHKKCCGK